MDEKIKQFTSERGIQYLVHFTRAENLPSIFKNGLLSREILENNWADYSYNDEYRYDGCLNAVCMSIGFPNYKMFYALRRENPEVEWAVLVLDAKILYEYDCAFCTTNAGSEKSYTISITNRKGVHALSRLYENHPNFTRKKQQIADHIPTDPQAEVLVFGNIDPSYILEICFEKSIVLNKYRKHVNGCSCEINTDAFSYRHDYDFWKKP